MRRSQQSFGFCTSRGEGGRLRRGGVRGRLSLVHHDVGVKVRPLLLVRLLLERASVTAIATAIRNTARGHDRYPQPKHTEEDEKHSPPSRLVGPARQKRGQVNSYRRTYSHTLSCSHRVLSLCSAPPAPGVSFKSRTPQQSGIDFSHKLTPCRAVTHEREAVRWRLISGVVDSAIWQSPRARASLAAWHTPSLTPPPLRLPNDDSPNLQQELKTEVHSKYKDTPYIPENQRTL
ncbi:hypothetical protein E2C01_028707 [Portunus trituberculatus]|uniref:Uncharacterized protein n=1 Tax=Portunus trituberculatus TaxID=210409 RepID=A0A5B7EPT5_PORTR|nr:hypothetical protein [Portunus trituberculatus]